MRGGELILAGLTRSVTEVFRMIGFDTVFATFADVEQAAASVSDGVLT